MESGILSSERCALIKLALSPPEIKLYELFSLRRTWNLAKLACEAGMANNVAAAYIGRLQKKGLIDKIGYGMYQSRYYGED
jgi:hypothetical protein